jgi:dihydrofolate reductase
MRKLIVSEFVTLDGVMQDPGGVGEFEHGGWTSPYWSDELAAYKHDELFESDGLLLGRVTYEGFAAAWPDMTHEEGDYAERMNGFPKYVVSRTLSDLTWNNSHLLAGDLEKNVVALKEQPGKDLVVFGSGQLVRSLAELDLIDEYRLQVYPVVIGSGTHLFGPAETPRPLQLQSTKSLASGVVILTYQRDPIRG